MSGADHHDSPEAPVLVLGATGGQGGAVAAALITAGRRVRALVRNAQTPQGRRLAAAGAELVTGDFTDVDALTAAMRGAAAAFTLTTPFETGPSAELAQGHAIITAAVESRLPHLVFSSVAGAVEHTHIPHFESKAEVEQLIVGSGIAHTIVAPTYFYDNALGSSSDILLGLLQLPLPADRTLQQLDRADLGSFVELILHNPTRFSGARIELASDQPTPLQMAQALSVALSRPVDYQQTPLSAVRSASADMGAMWDYLRGPGYHVDIAALQARYPDSTSTSFTDWAKSTFAANSSRADLQRSLRQNGER